MKFIPAIDLKDKKCVRLEQGQEHKATVYNEDPIQQAIIFEQNGCERIHIVDLDGAFGRYNTNKQTILSIRKNVNIPIELGGGIKNEDDVSFWLNEGINFLILGSLSFQNSELTINIVNKHPNKIYIALDILNEKIMIKGWVEQSDLLIKDVFSIYNKVPIKGYILTDVSRDGLLEGLNFNLIKKTAVLTKKNIIVGGGLSNYSDIETLRDKIPNPNLEGFIAGKSIYSRNIELTKVIELLK